MSESADLPVLLERNREWAAGITRSQPEFFSQLAVQQAPRYMWIGCSDSRVPANQILGLMPGEIFVHRNVANVVVHSDLNCLSSIQYAVDVLKVRDIIVCGHYGCGGVMAAYHNTKVGLVDNWLRHVQDVRDRNRPELDALGEDGRRVQRLCELNSVAQAIHVAETTIVREAWERGQELAIHPLVYGVNDGILRQMGLSIESSEALRALLP
ncbi:MAG: carbonic anhydrase [Steroidobacteraceae bacterium]